MKNKKLIFLVTIGLYGSLLQAGEFGVTNNIVPVVPVVDSTPSGGIIPGTDGMTEADIAEMFAERVADRVTDKVAEEVIKRMPQSHSILYSYAWKTGLVLGGSFAVWKFLRWYLDVATAEEAKKFNQSEKSRNEALREYTEELYGREIAKEVQSAISSFSAQEKAYRSFLTGQHEGLGLAISQHGRQLGLLSFRVQCLKGWMFNEIKTLNPLDKQSIQRIQAGLDKGFGDLEAMLEQQQETRVARLQEASATLADTSAKFTALMKR